MDYMVGLAQTLTGLAQSDTARYGFESVKALKNGRDKDAVITKYEEVFNNLVSENQELKRVALAYKDEYEKINITDENIEYLKNTFERVMDLIASDVEDQDGQTNRQEFEQFSSLIDVDTLKTMQLLGFNYKKAIGEPLTLILSDFITRKYNNTIPYAPNIQEQD